VTVPSSDERRLNLRQVIRLRDLLLACPVVKDLGSRRQTLIPQIEGELGESLHFAQDQRSDLEVVNLVRACLQFGIDRGLEALVRTVEAFDGQIDPVVELRTFVQEVVAPGLLPAVMMQKLCSIVPEQLISERFARQLAYQAAGGFARLGSEASFADIVYCLADLNIQQGGLFPHPLIAFVVLLTDNIQDKTAVKALNRWTAEAVNLFGIEQSQVDTLRANLRKSHQEFAPYLLVTVTPAGPDKELDPAVQEYAIEAWLVDERGGPKLSFHVYDTSTLPDLEQLVQCWLDRLADLLPRSMTRLTIECFLPHGLLGHPVDQLSLLIDESIELRSKLGQEYGVVVR
jgi:hypothetical protein